MNYYYRTCRQQKSMSSSDFRPNTVFPVSSIILGFSLLCGPAIHTFLPLPVCVYICVCLLQCMEECARQGGDRVPAVVHEPGCSVQLCLWWIARGTSPCSGCPGWANQAWALVVGSAHGFRYVQRCGTDPLMDSNMFSAVSVVLCWSLVCVCVLR